MPFAATRGAPFVDRAARRGATRERDARRDVRIECVRFCGSRGRTEDIAPQTVVARAALEPHQASRLLQE
jgi:hypothetical protein